jgi:hypothetical protein
MEIRVRLRSDAERVAGRILQAAVTVGDQWLGRGVNFTYEGYTPDSRWKLCRRYRVKQREVEPGTQELITQGYACNTSYYVALSR